MEYIHLPFNKNGYLDTRTGNIYSDVVCEVEDEKYFVKVEEEKESTNNDSIL